MTALLLSAEERELVPLPTIMSMVFTSGKTIREVYREGTTQNAPIELKGSASGAKTVRFDTGGIAPMNRCHRPSGHPL